MPEPGAKLVGQWAVCAIAAAAARFVPVPLLDDVIRQQATQAAVLSSLRASGRSLPTEALEPLYAGSDAGGGGPIRQALGYLARVPRRIAFFPVRKYVAIFGAVKGVPTDVMQVLMLARTAHRVLVEGRLNGATPEAVRAEARQLRQAFDATMDGMDLRMLVAALRDGLSQGRGLTAAAVGYARRTFTRASDAAPAPDAAPAADLDVDPGGALAQGARQVQEVLNRPEISRLLADFDSRLQAHLAAPP